MHAVHLWAPLHEGPFGFSILAKDTLACRWGRLGLNRQFQTTLPLSQSPHIEDTDEDVKRVCDDIDIDNNTDNLLLLRTHLCRGAPAVLCMCKRQTAGKLQIVTVGHV